MIAVLKQRAAKHLAKSRLLIRNKKSKDVTLTEYYFGYGANLDTNRFAKNHMIAKELGIAFLKDHKVLFTLATEYEGKGYAGIHPSIGDEVPGVLVKIDSLSLEYLDKLEWCGFGAYNRVKKTIICNHKEYIAWAYEVASPDYARVPSALYLSNMINAAKNRSFPKNYIHYLESQEYKDTFDIDHSFSLRTYSSSRKFVTQLKPLYKLHDKLREKICEII